MSTVFGMLTAFLLVIGAILLGGSPLAYINLQGGLIVILGTFAVTAISFRMQEMVSLPTNIWALLRHGQRDPNEEAIKVLKIAVEARKHNDILMLERLLPRLKDTPFLMQAMQLVVDGSQAEEIEQIMRRNGVDWHTDRLGPYARQPGQPRRNWPFDGGSTADNPIRCNSGASGFHSAGSKNRTLHRRRRPSE